MKRKLRKSLSWLLTVAMIFSLFCGMIPTASAVDGTLFRYCVESADLAKMLVQNNYSENEDVNGISITFSEKYVLKDTFDFYQPNPENSNDWVTTDFSNFSENVQPDKIEYLTIKLSDGTIQIKSEDLTWDYIERSPGMYQYNLMLRNPEVSTVTFMCQEIANLHWSEYTTRTVKTGTALGDQMPEPPEWIANHFVGWEIGSNDGTGEPLTDKTIIKSNGMKSSR